MAAGGACHSSSPRRSNVPIVAFQCRACTCRCCREIQVAHSDTVGECSLQEQLRLEERGGGATAAQGVHEGSTKVRFQRGGIAGSVGVAA